jgi:hypothetical protein
MTTVTIQEHHYEPDEPASWSLNFTIQTPEITAKFVVEEPYMKKYSEWLALALGDITLELYGQGNGEGYITRNGGNITFFAAPSGAGGDVSLKVTIPWVNLEFQFLNALEGAQNEGHAFRAE